MQDFNILTDKVVLVTGGTKGLGYSIAIAFAQAGAKVAVCSRNQSECNTVSQELSKYGEKCLGVSADITKHKDLENLLAAVIDFFGKIDVLVNNAGATFWMPVLKVAKETWDHIMNVHLKGQFFCAQIVGEKMIQQGHGKIINISSILGSVGEPNCSVYSIAKGGVNQLTKSLAIEWAPYNIQVNAIAPGYVATELTEEVMSDEKTAKYIIRRTPLRRLGSPEEIASLAVYLSSETANYITGQIVHVDGGWTVQ